MVVAKSVAGHQRSGKLQKQWVVFIAILALALVFRRPVAASEAMAVPANENQLQDFLRDVQRQGAAALEAENYESVDALRQQRLEILRRYGKLHPDSKNPWVLGVRALDLVDEPPETRQPNEPQLLTKLGLVGECRYEEAFKVLVEAFRAFDVADRDESGLLGDLAVRAVEVLHQAAGILSLEEVQDPKSQSFIATHDETVELLRIAARDDLCTLAIVYEQWVTPPDPKESFLRAELRENFRERQKLALKFSHPLSVVPISQRLQADIRDAPILPMHGVVEALKSRSLKWLVQDLEDTYVLGPDFTTDDYILPGVIIDCQDAAGTQIELIYGKQLLCRIVDENGRQRTAFVYYDSQEKKWSQRYLSLLYLEPREGANLSDEERNLKSLLATLPEEHSVKLGNNIVRQYAYPSSATADLLRRNTKILRVDDVWKLTDTRFRLASNETDQLVKRLPKYLSGPQSASKQEEAAHDPVKLSLEVYAACKAIELENDATVHPLVRLLEMKGGGESARKIFGNLKAMTPDDLKKADPDEYQRLLRNRRAGDRWMRRQAEIKDFLQNYGRTTLGADVSFNPLLVVSDADSAVAEPFWFQEFEGGVERKYIRSKKFGKVYFVQDQIDFSKSQFQFRVRAADVVYPLSTNSIPGQVILSTQAGQRLVGALEDAGYSREAALRELVNIWQTEGRELPDKFENFLQAKRRSATGLDLVEFFIPPAEKIKRYGFRYIIDPEGNFILNKGLESSSPDSDNDMTGALFTYIDPQGQKVPETQHYTGEDYSDLHRNVYLEHLSKAVSYFPCPSSWFAFHQERLRPLYNPSGRVPPYLAGWSKVSGETDMFRRDDLKYGEDKAPNGQGVDQSGLVRTEIPAPTKFLSDELIEVITGKSAGSAEARGLNRLAGFYSALWAAPITEGSTEVSEDLETFKRSAGTGFSRRDMLRHLMRFSARAFGAEGWDNSHASITLYNDLLAIDFLQVEQWPESSEYLMGGGGGLTPGGNGRLSVSDAGLSERRRVRSLFGKGGNVFQLVPDTQTGADLAGQIAAAVNTEAVKVELLLELAGVLSRTRYEATAVRIWDEVVASKDLYLDPFIKESKDYFEAYGLRLGRQVEGAIERYSDLVAFAAERRRTHGGGEGAKAGIANLADVGELDDAVTEYLSFDEAEVRRGLDRGRLEQWVRSSERLRVARTQASFKEWLQAMKRLSGRREAIVGRQYEFSPLLFLPLEYDAASGFRRVTDGQIFQDVLETLAENPEVLHAAGWGPQGEAEVRLAVLLGWFLLERENFSDARRAYTLAAEGYFRLYQVARDQGDEVAALKFQLNAYQQLCARESVVYRSPGCVDSSVRIYAGVLGPLLMWERRWFAAGLEGAHGRLARIELLQLFDQIEDEIISRRAGRDGNRIYFADYRSQLGGAIPDPLLVEAIDSAWFREITTAEEEVAKLERALDEVGEANPQDNLEGKVREAKEKRDALYGQMLQKVISLRADGLDKEIAGLGR